jgi:RNA polymerase sigma-70 factor, ECF subfamily
MYASSESEQMPVDQWAGPISDLSVDDRALMNRIAAGNLDALETLYYRFHPRLAHFLWRLIGRREGLEEIVNDIFVDVWIGARHFPGASPVVSAWMFDIASRKALEYLRQQWSSSGWSDMRHPPEQAKFGSDNGEVSDALSQRLGAVPFEQRLALLLTYQMGYGLQEIAAITGVSAAIVKARILWAREKLRSLWREEAPSVNVT